MEHLKKTSREQNRYESPDPGHEMIDESLDNHSEKWPDESLMIRMDSPSGPCNNIISEKPSLSQFTHDYIKSLPEYIVKKIIETRSECSINCSRETKLLSKNNSYRGKIRELGEEIGRLNLVIEDLSCETQRTIKKQVKTKKNNMKEQLTQKENELNKNISKIKNIQEILQETQKKLEISTQNEEKQEKELKKLKEIVKAYEDICEFSQIQFIKAKLEELSKLQLRIQEVSTNCMAYKDKNSKLENEVDMLKLEDKNKEKQFELLNLQIKTLEENNILLELRVQSLEHVLKDKNRTHQDLLGNFKLLQDELIRVTRPAKKENPNSSEIERLKTALALKLSEKSKKS